MAIKDDTHTSACGAREVTEFETNVLSSTKAIIRLYTAPPYAFAVTPV